MTIICDTNERRKWNHEKRLGSGKVGVHTLTHIEEERKYVKTICLSSYTPLSPHHLLCFSDMYCVLMSFQKSYFKPWISVIGYRSFLDHRFMGRQGGICAVFTWRDGAKSLLLFLSDVRINDDHLLQAKNKTHTRQQNCIHLYHTLLRTQDYENKKPLLFKIFRVSCQIAAELTQFPVLSLLPNASFPSYIFPYFCFFHQALF